MTRPQFWILNVMSGLVAFFLLLQALFAWQSQKSQARVISVQQLIQQAQLHDQQRVQLAREIAQVVQQTQDTELRDLLTREGFTIRVNNGNSSSAPSAPSTPAVH